MAKTLDTLRAEVQIRLGFINAGSAAQAQRALIESMLQRAQEFLYAQVYMRELEAEADQTLNAGQVLYDWPTDMNRRKDFKLRALVNGQWQPLRVGIGPDQETISETGFRSYPQRYLDRAQIEVWPVPDQTYTLRIQYYKALARFTQANDVVTVPDDLVFMLALANAKSHFRQPDAEQYGAMATNMLRELRGAAHNGRRYIRGANKPESLPRPIVE